MIVRKGLLAALAALGLGLGLVLSVLCVTGAADASVPIVKGAGVGFGVLCSPVHETDNVDPILNDNRTHAHAFDGGGKGLDISVRTTSAQLRKSTTSCRHSADKALYWAPKASSPVQTQVNYYQPKDITNPSGYHAFPANLQMIAGSVSKDGSNNLSPHVRFGCQATPATARRPFDCGLSRFKVEVDFPDCVIRNANGTVRETSSSGRGHVYYSDGGGNCKGNDLKVPQLKQHWIYDQHDGRKIRWSVPWYDLHADFMNGFNPSAMQSLIDTCINGNHDGCLRISN